jgi:hypothetical protein
MGRLLGRRRPRNALQQQKKNWSVAGSDWMPVDAVLLAMPVFTAIERFTFNVMGFAPTS